MTQNTKKHKLWIAQKAQEGSTLNKFIGPQHCNRCRMLLDSENESEAMPGTCTYCTGEYFDGSMNMTEEDLDD